MVIVTKRCFVIAESIHNITIFENHEGELFLSSKKRSQNKHKHKYTIRITYKPVASANGSRDVEHCEVSCYDKKVTEGLFAEMVKQYREQNPDSQYLDKIVEGFLN